MDGDLVHVHTVTNVVSRVCHQDGMGIIECG